MQAYLISIETAYIENYIMTQILSERMTKQFPGFNYSKIAESIFQELVNLFPLYNRS